MRVGSLELILSLISSTGSMVACVSTLYLYYPLHMMYLTAPKEKSNECSINVVLVLLLLVNMFAAGNVIASASVALMYQDDIPNWLCMVGGTVDQFTGFVCSCLMILFVINVKLVLGNSTTHLQSLNMIMFSLMMLLATVLAALTITQDWVKGGQQAWCSIMPQSSTIGGGLYLFKMEKFGKNKRLLKYPKEIKLNLNVPFWSHDSSIFPSIFKDVLHVVGVPVLLDWGRMD